MALTGIVEADVELEYYYQREKLDDDDIPDLKWHLDRLTITPSETPTQLYGRDEGYMAKGTNEADRLFCKGYHCGFKSPTKALDALEDLIRCLVLDMKRESQKSPWFGREAYHKTDHPFFESH